MKSNWKYVICKWSVRIAYLQGIPMILFWIPQLKALSSYWADTVSLHSRLGGNFALNFALGNEYQLQVEVCGILYHSTRESSAGLCCRCQPWHNLQFVRFAWMSFLSYLWRLETCRPFFFYEKVDPVSLVIWNWIGIKILTLKICISCWKLGFNLVLCCRIWHPRVDQILDRMSCHCQRNI